jgi:5'(3')-deoxyribonucleotidase
MDDFIIGLDLDGVCYHFDRTARYMLRQRIVSSGRIVPDDLLVPAAHWNSIRDCVTDDDWDWLWSDGVRAGLFRYGHVVGGSIEGIQALNNLGDVIVITARPKEAVHDTLVWLSTMFDKAPLSGVVIQSHGQKKSEVNPRPHVYIDDGVHNVNDILDNTKAPVILYQQPWNSGYPVNDWSLAGIRVYPAQDWNDVVRAVTAIKENGAYDG